MAASLRKLLIRHLVKNLLIVYASQTGRTANMASAVQRGAQRLGDDINTRLRHALSASLDDLLWANGLLIGSPENFGYMAGAVKDFLDRTYYPAQGLVSGLPYALFICAGNDGSGAIRSIERIAQGYPLNAVLPPQLVKGEPTAADLAECELLGETMAAGLVYGIY
jgi:flavorubredoxin